MVCVESATAKFLSLASIVGQIRLRVSLRGTLVLPMGAATPVSIAALVLLVVTMVVCCVSRAGGRQVLFVSSAMKPLRGICGNTCIHAKNALRKSILIGITHL